MNQQAIWDSRYANARNSGADGWLDQYEAYINAMKGSVAVDLGCGRGEYAGLLAGRGYRVVACDFSPVAVGYVREAYPTVEARCLDIIQAFPADIKNAGIVLASLSTHYFALEDTKKLYRNIRGALKAGGCFILRVNSREELARKDRAHIQAEIEPDYYRLDDGTAKRYFTADSLSALLEGFSVERLRESSSAYAGNEKHYVECLARKA
jgi:SAM-dependent methyltransferase